MKRLHCMSSSRIISCLRPRTHLLSVRHLSESKKPANSWMLCASGQDRLGIVNEMSRVLSQHQYNIERSRMTRLSSDFAVLMHLTNNKAKDEMATEASVKTALSAQFPDFFVSLRKLVPVVDKAAVAHGLSISTRDQKAIKIQAHGPDQPMIIKRFSDLILNFRGTILDLSTDVYNAPFSAETMFFVESLVSFPNTIDAGDLKSSLDKFCESTGFDYQMEEEQLDGEEEKQEVDGR